MKKSRIKLMANIFSIALLASVGLGVGGTVNTPKAYATVTKNAGLTLAQLREKALTIIPGTIVKTKYDYDNGVRIVEFKIIDKNGIKRELELVAATGQVWDIDYDYDQQGNRFINQSLFEVNVTYEQAMATALQRIPGTVLNHKQDADNGLFIYEFIIQGKNGAIYEVDVETKGGTILKVEIEDDYNPYNYNYGPVVIPGQQGQGNPGGASPSPSTSQTPGRPQSFSEAELRKKVLDKFPGVVVEFEADYDDGIMEYEYKIRQKNGVSVEVKINEFGYITDVDY